MANDYKTPGVYVEEISTLPASVAQVETAIPAFIGYTEKAERLNGDPITGPHRITSLLEYESLFGGPELEGSITVSVSTDADGNRTVKANELKDDEKSIFLMYYGMKMYFMNGGGPCYIVSVGKYDGGSISEGDLKDGLDLIEKEDEPTLIIFPDATNLDSSAVFNTLYSQGLAQCNKLKDRFTIADVFLPDGNDDPIVKFREISSDYYKYGAAYYPWLKTTLNYHYKDKDVGVTLSGITAASKFTLTDAIVNKLAPESNTSESAGAEDGDKTLTQLQFDSLYGSSIIGTEYATETSFKTAVKSKASTITDDKFTIIAAESKTTGSGSSQTLEVVKSEDNELYNLIKANLKNLNVTIPPSSAMAGVYARVDNDRGVWKAPANVTLTGVIEPSIKITHEAQEGLNVDPTSGKSINAIRAFTGKGVMVWGARTLAGNDNEWRYIPVRRLFNMVEESVKKATEFVVFEPNDANTWVRIKAMIENYLTGLWRAGALAGAKTDQAFFVNVGLGKTMTTVDILEGRMNIEIGMAAVRPAEFIILKFSHKLQES